MTTAETQNARSGWWGRTWRGFRRWRRQRPFWAGLFTMLAGLEIFGSTQMSLDGLSVKMGPTGFLAWLIPAILFTCGLLLWLSPAQRIFYAVVAAVTAVYSLIGVNLGGFFVGLVLGMVGSALGFAWVPVKRPVAPPPVDEPAADEEIAEERPADWTGAGEPALVDDLMPRQREEEHTGVLTDTVPPPRNPLRESAPTEPAQGTGPDTVALPVTDPERPAQGGRHREPRTYAILLVVATAAAAGLLGLRTSGPAVAAPSCPTPTESVKPTESAKPTAKPTATAKPTGTAEPTASATSSSAATPSAPASADPEKSSDGNLLTDIVGGITDLLTGGDSDEKDTTATASPSPTASPEGEPSATPSRSASTDEPTPQRPARSPKPGGTEPGRCPTPTPTTPREVEPGKPLPMVATDDDLPRVAAKPGKLTGSSQTMTGLRFEGIAELDTADGTLRTLMFTMDKAVTNDFVLAVDGPAGKTVRYVTEQLIVKGDVRFFATRFVGWLGPLKVTLTPDLPFPDGIPITSPVPITFTKVDINLAYIDCDTLTANTRGPLNIELA